MIWNFIKSVVFISSREVLDGLHSSSSEFTKNDPVSEYHSDSASDIVCIKLLTVVFLEEFI